jgi:hypothetical protein
MEWSVYIRLDFLEVKGTTLDCRRQYNCIKARLRPELCFFAFVTLDLCD